MKNLFRIKALENKRKKRKKKCIVISIPHYKSKMEQENFVSTKNLKADLFVFITNYSKHQIMKISEFYY